MRKISVIIEKTKTGYSAYAADYPVFTTGRDLDELKLNMVQALNLHFEDSGKSITESQLKISLDLPQLFEFYKVINAKALSERMGMNQSLLSQYIHGKKQPSSAQTNRILREIQKLGRELQDLRLI